jgi:hypothetical protein
LLDIPLSYIKDNGEVITVISVYCINPLNAELNPICHLLALLGAHHIFHISGLRVNVLYCTVLYCTVLYCTVLYCTVLYCTAQRYASAFFKNHNRVVWSTSRQIITHNTIKRSFIVTQSISQLYSTVLYCNSYIFIIHRHKMEDVRFSYRLADDSKSTVLLSAVSQELFARFAEVKSRKY